MLRSSVQQRMEASTGSVYFQHRDSGPKETERNGMSFIYLDNAATTETLPEAAEAAANAMLRQYANPSSRHSAGLAAERLLTDTRRRLASLIGASPDEIVFTSGGTESNNLAILGHMATAGKGSPNQGPLHLITSATEHPSVLEPAYSLANQRAEVMIVRVDRTGQVDLLHLNDLLRPTTSLVSLMFVNNELGTINPVTDAARLIRSKAPQAALHVDAVQALGKIPVKVTELGADYVSLSAHKLHGPKGVGALWVRSGRRLKSLVFGGGQERSLRSGTENVPGIAGFGAALDAAARHSLGASSQLMRLKLRLWGVIQENLPWAVINGPDPAKGAPHILNLAFPGLRADVLANHFEERGLFVSTGAACASKKMVASHVLKAIGCPEQLAAGSIRFSMGWLTTDDHIDEAARIVVDVCSELRDLMGVRR